MSEYKNSGNNNMLWEQGARFESWYPDTENQGVTEM